MKSRARMTILAMLMAAVLAGGVVWALPEVDQVQNGTVDVQRSDTTMTINASNNSIVNYKSFSIMPNETVVINLPSTDSQILNRVTGPDSSQILGSLRSNGVFILVNPNGIYVGPTARIEAASAILSTRDLSNERFLRGEYVFNKIAGNGADVMILNEGAIHVANGGYCALIAGAIENKGLITAKYGTIALAAGNVIRLELAGSRLIGVAVEEAVAKTVYDHQGRPVLDQIKNTGTLDAEGGTVILQARSVEQIFQRLINTEGVIQATHLEEKDGKVSFVANGPVNLQGAIRATEIRVGDAPQNAVPNIIVVHKEATVVAEKNINMVATELIEINATIQAPTVDLVSQGLIDTTSPTAIIQGQNVQLQANRFGRTATPVNIDADTIYIKRLNGDIDIRQSLGIGSSIWIRGPPEGDSFGEIFYNKNASQLTLAGVSLFTSGDPAQNAPVSAQKLVLIAENSIGSIDHPFYFNASILAGATAVNGSITLTSGNTDVNIRGDIRAAGDINLYSGAGAIDIRGENVVIGSTAGSINLEATTGSITIIGTVAAPLGTVRIWTSKTMDVGGITLYSKDGSFIWNPEDEIVVTWDRGAGTNNWADANNWNPNGVPNTNAYRVTITKTSGGGYTINTATNYTIGALNLGTAGNRNCTLNLGGNLTIDNTEGSVTGAGNLAIGTYGILNANTYTISLMGSLTNAGTLNVGTGTINYSGANAQTINSAIAYYNLATSAASGNWTKTVSATTTVNGSLTVGSNSTLDIGAYNITVTGATSVSGTLTHSSATGTKTYVGLVTINPTGTWNNSGNAAITMRGGITNNGTFTAGSGVYTFNTNAQALNGTISIPNITVTGVTLTNNGTLTVSTALSGTGTLAQGTDAVLNIEGTAGIATLTATASGNTVNYSGAAQTVKPVTYHHLGLAGSDIKDLTGLTTINGNLILTDTVSATTAANLAVGGYLDIGAGASFTVAGYNFTVSGTTSVGGTLTHSSATGTKIYTGLVAVTGDWVNSGNSPVTFRGGITYNSSSTIANAGTGVYTFDTNNQAVGGASAFGIPNVTVSGITLTNNSTLGFGVGNLAGTGTLTQSADAVLNIEGSVTIANLDASASGNIVSYAGAAAQAVKTTTYYNLAFSGAGAKTPGSGTLAINGYWSVESPVTLETNDPTVTVAGDFSGTGNIRLGSKTLTVGNASNTTYSGVMSGAGGLTKQGSGILTLSGVNTYLGSTTINAGILRILGGNDRLPATTAVTLANVAGAALDLNDLNQTIASLSGGGTTGGNVTLGSGILTVGDSSNTTYSGVISGTGGVIVKQAGGILSLRGANTYTGGTTLQGGWLDIVNGALGTTGNITFAGGGILYTDVAATEDISARIKDSAAPIKIYANGSDISFASAIDSSNTGGLLKMGTRILSLTAVNSYTGGTTIQAGWIEIVNGALGTTGDISFTGGSLLYNNAGANEDISGRIANSTGPIYVHTYGNNVTFASAIGSSNTGGLVKDGPGTLVLAAANAYTGDTTIQAGSLEIANGALGSSGSIHFTGGVLVYATGATEDISGRIKNSTAAINVNTNGNNVTYAGAIDNTNTAGLVKTGPGILALSGANTYTGGTTINAGTLSFTSGALSSSGNIIFTGGTLLYAAGNTQDISARIKSSTAAVAVDTGSNSVTFASVVDNTNTAGLSKYGAGTLILSAANTYTGTTTVSAGTLQIGAGSTTGSIAGDIVNDASLVFNRSNGITYNGAISGAGSLTKQGAGTLTLGGTISQGGDFIISAGTVTVGANAISVGGNWTNNGVFNAGTGTVTFTGSGTSVISGSTTFYNLTCTTAGKQLTFTAGSTQIITGTLTLTGAVGNLIILRSSSSPTQWRINPQGTRNVSYVDVQDSNNINATVIDPATSADRGNNTNWFTLRSITGTVYSDRGTTLIGTGRTIVLIVDGTSKGSVTTNGSSVYTFSNIGLPSGSTVLVYISGDTYKGNTVTIATTANITGLNIYGNTVIAGHENAGPVTNATFATAKGAQSSTDILYAVSGSNMTINAGVGFMVKTGKTYTPGGNLTCTDLIIQTTSTYNAGSSLITVSGSFTSTGVFNAGTSTVNYNASGAQTVAGVTYNNLTLSGSGVKTTTGVTVNGILSMEGTATASVAPTYGAAATLQYNTDTARIAGPEWLNTFAATGGVIIANTGAITLNAAKVFNANIPLTINSGATLTTGNYALTFGGNFVNNGTFNAGSSNITISGTAATQSIGGFTTTGTVSMTKTAGTATLTGDMSAGALTMNGAGGTLNLGTGLTHTVSGTWTRTNGTLNGGSSTLKLGGTVTGTGGAFTASSGTVNYNAAGAQTMALLTYNNLTLSGSGAKTFPTGTITVNGILSMEDTATATVTGTLTYGANSTLRYNTATSRATGGEWKTTGFTGSGGIWISNTGVITLNAARTTGNTKLTIDAGSTFALGGYNFGFASSTAVINNGTFQLYGSETLTNVANLDIDSGLVKYVGTGGPYTIKDFGAGTDYYNVQFQATTGNPTTGLIYNITSTLTVANNMTISRAMVKQGTSTVSIGGSLYLDSGGYYTKATGGQAITFTGSTPATIGDYNTYSDLGVIVVDKTDSTLTLSTSIIVDRMTVNSGSTLNMGAGRHVLKVANAGAVADVLVVNGGFIGGLSTVQFTATNSSGNINVPNLAYDTLQLSGAETYVLTGHQDGAKALTGDATIDSGATLDLTASNYNLSCSDVTIKVGGALNGRGSTISVADHWYGFGTFTAGTSTVDFTHPHGLQSLYAGGVGTGHQFYNLTHSGAGILQFNESGVYISNNLTNSAGAIEINGNNLTVDGAFSNAGGILRVVGFETVSLINDITAGTVEYTGSGSYAGLAVGSQYYNLSFSGAGTFTLNGPVIVYGSIGLQATPDFKYFRELTIQYQYVKEDMTYVPIVFVFSGYTNRDDIMSGSNYTIKFTNANSVALSYEVENYDPVTGQLIVWIKVDSLSTTQDTKLYMYYGSSQTEALDNPKDVWRDSSFDAVWHFQDLNDSSWNENNGTNHGTTSVTGMIGNGRQFDNANFKVAPYNYPDSQYITTDLNLDLWLGGSSFVSMWVKPATTWTGADTDWQAPGIIGVEDNATVNDIYYGMADSTGKIYTAVGDTTGAKTTVSMNDGTWRYVVMTRDATTGVTNMYVNGVLVSTVTSDTGFKTTAFYSIGRKEDTKIPPLLYPQYYYGAIDELRISTVFKSANWILTQYNNQNDPISFTGVGQQTTGFKPTLDCGSQNLTLYGNMVNNGTFNANTGTVTFAGNSTISGATIPVFNNITIAATGTLTAPSGTLTVGGNWTNNGTFNHNNGTVDFTGDSATIIAGSSPFYNVKIDAAAGGVKTLGDDVVIDNDLAVNSGSLEGVYDVTVKGGDVTGAGTINMTGGTFLVEGSGSFGGSGADWTFSTLAFGDGTTPGAITKSGDNEITVNDKLTILPNQTLHAGSSQWNLVWASYLRNIIELAAGYDHTIALIEDGSVYAWGNNLYGQLGDGKDAATEPYNATPVQVLSGEQGGGTYLHDITHIAAGGYHNLALDETGAVYAWGYNGGDYPGGFGQLGNNGTVDSTTPVQVLSGAQGGGTYLHGISWIAAGGFSSAAVASDNTVYTWGYNSFGMLGNNSTDERSLTPVHVVGTSGSGALTGVAKVAVGGMHMLALSQAGTVYAWGNNAEGELGIGSTTPSQSAIPVQVLSGAQGGGTYLHDVAQVSAGEMYCAVVTTGGSVYTWGYNANGQLGNNTTTDSASPVQVLGGAQGGSYLSNIATIATGAAHIVAVAGDGSVYTWGENGEYYGTYGQLDDGTTINRPAPVQALSGAQGGGAYLHGIARVAAGGNQTLAASQTNSVYAAGGNADGQLGNGTTVGAPTDIRVIGGGQGGSSSSNTPFVIYGTFITDTATINYATDTYHHIVYVAAATYYNLNFTNTAGASYVLAGHVTTGDLMINQTTFSAGAYNITVTGNWTNTGGVFEAGTGTVTFSGTGLQTIASGGSAFNSLAVTNTSAGGVAFQDRLVTGTLTAGSGVKKVAFAYASLGTPNTITTSFNVNGSAGNLIELTSLDGASTWYLDAPKTTHQYLRIGFSYEVGGSAQTQTATNSQDAGGNTNWTITP